jgi:sporulation protein YlmC with PRC-barrel domain
MKDYERNLQRFSDMDDVEVSEEDPDVRGWDVVTRDGHDIGEVKDLLVDTRSMKVRCLEVELEGSHFKWNDNRRVAIPVESVELDEEHDDVVIQGMALDEIGRLDEYRPDLSSPTAASRTGLPDTASRDIRPAADAPRGAEARFESDEIRGPVTEDDVILERRPLVREELVIGKEPTEENPNVEADLKKERFDNDKQDRVLDEGDERPTKGRR